MINLLQLNFFHPRFFICIEDSLRKYILKLKQKLKGLENAQ